MNDGSIWRLLPIPYLLIKIFGLILHRHMAVRHTLCVRISYRRVSHQHVNSTYLMRMCTSEHKQIWTLSSDKKILHANLFQRIQARSSEINIYSYRASDFQGEFLKITSKIWSDIFWKMYLELIWESAKEPVYLLEIRKHNISIRHEKLITLYLFGKKNETASMLWPLCKNMC